MWREAGTISSPSRTGEAVFAVQTASTKRTGDIDYVVVASVTNAGLTHWEIGYARGHLAAARTTILWAGAPSAGAPLSESISLQTDAGLTNGHAYMYAVATPWSSRLTGCA